MNGRVVLNSMFSKTLPIVDKKVLFPSVPCIRILSLLVVVPWGCDFRGCDFKGCDLNEYKVAGLSDPKNKDPPLSNTHHIVIIRWAQKTPFLHFCESFRRLATSRFHRFSDVDTVFYLSIYLSTSQPASRERALQSSFRTSESIPPYDSANWVPHPQPSLL